MSIEQDLRDRVAQLEDALRIELEIHDAYISRTSMVSDEKPCEGAEKVEIPYIDIRDCGSPKEIRDNKGTDGDWYVRGKNHCIVDGRIRRELGTETVWKLEIKSLPEFIRKYGKCVMRLRHDGVMEIEIYDTYRE